MNGSDNRMLPALRPSSPATGCAAKAADRAGAGLVSAQVAGQEGARRGLRGGEPLMRAARAAYLRAEFSGDDDRRPPVGLVRRAEV